MAQPTRRPRLAPARPVDRGEDPIPAAGADDPAAAPNHHVRTRVSRRVVVLEVAGCLDDVGEDLDRAIQLGLAEVPRGVVCDLSAVPEGALPDALELLATAGRHVRDWAAIPVAVACPDPRVRAGLTPHPLGGHLIVTSSMRSALSAVLATPVHDVEWLRLAPHPTAPRASRDFVTRTLLDWRLGGVITAASLVVSELVTNSTMYAGTDIALSIAWDHGSLRLTVRDNSPRLPHQRHSALDLHGRGLTIVAGLSRAFGVLPTADGGKVVWAVIDAPRRAPAPSPRRSESVTKESPMLTVLGSVPATALASVPDPVLASVPRPVLASVPRPVLRAVPPAPVEGHRALVRHEAAGHEAWVTKPRATRTLIAAQAGTTQHPHPYNDPSNYLG